MKMLAAALLVSASLPSFAQQTYCYATTRGPYCVTCGAGEMYNTYIRKCEPTSCPPGATVLYLHGGGVRCSGGGTSGGAADASPPMCIDGNLRVVPCDSLRASRCSMTEEWSLGDPNHPGVTAIARDGDASNAGACAEEADVAASQTTTRIIKLRKGETP